MTLIVPEAVREPYAVLMSDPPWRFAYRREPSGLVSRRRRAVHDRRVPSPQLARWPVDRLAQDDAHLYLWTPGPLLEQGMALLRLWGFPFRSLAFVWVKVGSRSGRPVMGQGYHTRANAELCLLGVRGDGLPRCDAGVRALIEAPRAPDGLKPVEAYRRIERLTGDRRRLEMWARREWPGWDAWKSVSA